MRSGPTLAGAALWWIAICVIWLSGRVLYFNVACLGSLSTTSVICGGWMVWGPDGVTGDSGRFRVA